MCSSVDHNTGLANSPADVNQLAPNSSTMTIGRPSAIQLLLVADQALLLRGVESLLRLEAPDIQIVGKATSSEEACELSRKLNPDVILLDFELDGDNCLDLLPQLIKNDSPRVLIYSRVNDSGSCQEAVLLGARGMLHKTSSAQTLAKAIRCVMAGELWLDRVSAGHVLTTLLRSTNVPSAKPTDARLSKLTRREREIVAAMCVNTDRPAKRVAATLKISNHTLRNHLSAIYYKFGIANRSQLCSFAEQDAVGAVIKQL